MFSDLGTIWSFPYKKKIKKAKEQLFNAKLMFWNLLNLKSVPGIKTIDRGNFPQKKSTKKEKNVF